ncbi:hypothetical protein F2Q70_00017520 [Brassica cretica]|uniref:Uncharacterized protein n=1 Tax=Brassica cretica TaxID=69181 RepID=A0A8S9HV93_BRACR|nr:hypothetical protein F2Q70_00017520 [Brassica cretica]
MSTHTLQAQGRRSTVALPERTEAHWECRPGAKSKHIAPYARDTKVIGKADGEGHQHPGTASMTYIGPYPYGSILKAGSAGLSTIKAGEYTQ